MKNPRVLIISSCTAKKKFNPPEALEKADFQDPKILRKKIQKLASQGYSCEASSMYTGAQHKLVMDAMRLMRSVQKECSGLDLYILSAGYGLIAERTIINPYNTTFSSMKSAELSNWAGFLKIKSKFEATVENYDLIFLLLGEKYLKSLSLPIRTRGDQTFIILSAPKVKKIVNQFNSKAFFFPLSTAEASLYSYGMIGLKGYLFKKFVTASLIDLSIFSTLYQDPSYFKDLIDVSLGIR